MSVVSRRFGGLFHTTTRELYSSLFTKPVATSTTTRTHDALPARFPVIVRSKWNLETIAMTDAEP